jgi:hypothetical protein
MLIIPACSRKRGTHASRFSCSGTKPDPRRLTSCAPLLVYAQVRELRSELTVILTDRAVSVLSYSYLNSHGGGSTANSPVGDEGADLLLVNITDTRNLLKSLGLSVPVGNSDAGSYFNTKVMEAIDYGVCLG